MSNAHLIGPDVSRFQGAINWSAVGRKAEFAIAQACDGIPTSSDPHAEDDFFVRNWHGMEDAGLIRGAYCFSRPAPGRRAKEEVEHIARLVGEAGGLRAKGDLGLIPDFEWNAPGMTLGELERWVTEWWETAHEIQGRWPISYTGSWWRESGLTLKAHGPLWLAAYVPNPAAYIPKPSWTHYTFWQRTSTNTEPGVEGTSDMNVFAGSRAELERLASLSKFAKPKHPHHPSHSEPVKPHKPVKPHETSSHTKAPTPHPAKHPAPHKAKSDAKGLPAGAPAGLPRRFWHHWRFPWGMRARHSAAFRKWCWQHGYLSPNFTRAEWACHDGQAIPATLRKGAQRHAFNMERLRHMLGDIPIPTISAFRDRDYNTQIGGATESKHIEAIATDHSKEWVESVGRAKFMAAAEKVFATGGLGIYPWGAFHLDSRGYKARWSSW